jgi:hypothetical protein
MTETDRTMHSNDSGELPWIIPRSELEAMDADQLREVIIDMHEKMGRLLGVVRALGAGNKEVEMILNPSLAAHHTQEISSSSERRESA